MLKISEVMFKMRQIVVQIREVMFKLRDNIQNEEIPFEMRVVMFGNE